MLSFSIATGNLDCSVSGIVHSHCDNSKSDHRVIEVNHRPNEYKRKAAERLTSEEGLRRRGRRCIKPEAVFGQMKANMNYKRFRYFSIDKVTMDFAFFAIAFNIKKRQEDASFLFT